LLCVALAGCEAQAPPAPRASKPPSPQGPPPQPIRIQVGEAAISPDGQLALTNYWYEHRDPVKDLRPIFVWDLATGQPLRVLTRHAGTVSLVGFLPDSRHALVRDWEAKAIQVWDVHTGTQVRALAGVQRWEREDPEKGVVDLRLSPAGQLALGYADGTVKLWDPLAGRFVWSAGPWEGRIHSLVFLPENKLAFRVGDPLRPAKGTPVLAAADTGRELNSFAGYEGYRR
jgi:WD40 repeat protein